MREFERGDVVSDRYEVRQRIGSGGMGSVYLTWDRRLDRQVAFKTMNTDAVAEEHASDFLRRFKLEAKVLAQLRHPNIVQIFDYGVEGDTPFFVMEFFDGLPLTKWGDRTKPSIPQWLGVAKQVFQALGHAHRRGVLHRDIKAANVLVRGEASAPEVALIDWGVALNASATKLTQTGGIVGTPGNIDPVMWLSDQGQWTPQSDFFAVGVLLYAALCGRKPVQVPSNTPEMRLPQVYARNAVVPPHTVNPAVDGFVEAFLLRLLATNPEHRPASAAAAIAMIEALERGEEYIDFDAISAQFPNDFGKPSEVPLDASSAVEAPRPGTKKLAANDLGEEIVRELEGQASVSKSAVTRNDRKQSVDPGSLPLVSAVALEETSLSPAPSVAKPSRAPRFEERVAEFQSPSSPRRKWVGIAAAAGAVTMAFVLGAIASKPKQESAAKVVENAIPAPVTESDLAGERTPKQGIDQFVPLQPADNKGLVVTATTRAQYAADTTTLSPPPPVDAAYKPSKGGPRQQPQIDRSLRPAAVEAAVQEARESKMKIPHGTRVQAQLLDTLDTGSGDDVKAELVSSLVVQDERLLPIGTKLRGRSSLRNGRPQAQFDRAILPDGTERKITAVAVTLDGREGIDGGEYAPGTDPNAGAAAKTAGKIIGDVALDVVGEVVPGGDAVSRNTRKVASEQVAGDRHLPPSTGKSNRMLVARRTVLNIEFRSTL